MNGTQKQEFCQQSFILQDVSLEIESFEEFYEKRKDILTAKLRILLR